jgi:hypothetical protein
MGASRVSRMPSLGGSFDALADGLIVLKDEAEAPEFLI